MYNGPFHWRNRRLRLGEIARLQSFPDWYPLSPGLTERATSSRERGSSPAGRGGGVASAAGSRYLGEGSWPAALDVAATANASLGGFESAYPSFDALADLRLNRVPVEVPVAG